MKWVKTFIIAAKYENFRKASGVFYLLATMVKEEIKSKRLMQVTSKWSRQLRSYTYVVTKIETSETKKFLSFLNKHLKVKKALNMREPL